MLFFKFKISELLIKKSRKFREIFFQQKSWHAFSLAEISIVLMVVGILVAGIVKGSEIIADTSLKTAKNLSSSSRIGRTNGLVLWLDAISEKSFNKTPDSGETIGVWKDFNPTSISSVAANASSVAFYPSYVAKSINNLPAINFKKTSISEGDCLNVVNSDLASSSEDFTIFILYQPTTIEDGIILEKNNATASSFPYSLEIKSGFYKFSVKNSSSTISVYGAKAPKLNMPYLIRLTRSKGANIEITINGVASSATDNLNESVLNSSELSIGCRNGATPVSFLNGNIGELAIFNRNLGANEKTEIENYFYKKWKFGKYEGASAATNDLSAITCAVSPALNAVETSVSFTESGSLTCKPDYQGAITYSCLANNNLQTAGACTPSACTFVQSNYSPQCYTSSYTTTFSFGASGMITNCPNNYSMRYKCNSDATLQIETKAKCYCCNPGQYVNHSGIHPSDLSLMGTNSTCRYCNNGSFVNASCTIGPINGSLWSF